MNTYRILSGTFALPDGTRLGPGDTIELASDVAAMHAALLEPVSPPADEPAPPAAPPAP